MLTPVFWGTESAVHPLHSTLFLWSGHSQAAGAAEPGLSVEFRICRVQCLCGVLRVWGTSELNEKMGCEGGYETSNLGSSRGRGQSPGGGRGGMDGAQRGQAEMWGLDPRFPQQLALMKGWACSFQAPVWPGWQEPSNPAAIFVPCPPRRDLLLSVHPLGLTLHPCWPWLSVYLPCTILGAGAGPFLSTSAVLCCPLTSLVDWPRK
jgi:hypothetical protein